MPRPKKSTYNNEKPPLSYVALCAMAIRSSSTGTMSLNEIYRFIVNTFPYYKNTGSKWRNSLRHNLSFNDCFVKIIRGSENGNKRSLWSLHPHCGDMFEDGSLLRRKRRFVTKIRGNEVTEQGLEKVDLQSENIACYSTMPKSKRRQTESGCSWDAIQMNDLVDNSTKATILERKTERKENPINYRSNSTNFSIDNILRGSFSKQNGHLETGRKSTQSQGFKISVRQNYDSMRPSVFRCREHCDCHERQVYEIHGCTCEKIQAEMRARQHIFEWSAHQNRITSHLQRDPFLSGSNKETVTLHYKACWS